MAWNEIGHRSDEITAYLSDTLEPEEKAVFEAHLATCEECQRELEAQRVLFSRVNEALAFKGKRTIDEQVARFEREVAGEKEAARGVPRDVRRRTITVGVTVIATMAMGIVLGFLVGKAKPEGGVGPGTMAAADAGTGEKALAAPQRPEVDGGLDGGGEER